MSGLVGTGIEAIVGGGTANGGKDIYFVLRTDTGRKPLDMRFVIAHDIVPIMISHLITNAGLAQNERSSRNPDEGDEATFASRYAMQLTGASSGRGVKAELAVLTLRLDATEGRKLNFYVTADTDGLDALADACRSAKALLQSPSQR